MTLDEHVYNDPFVYDPSRFLPKPQGRGEPFPTAAFGFGRRSVEHYEPFHQRSPLITRDM